MASASTSQQANRRLLFFTKNLKALKPVLEYLKLQHYSVATLDHFRDPVTAIQAVKPQAVLLSWSMGSEEVKRLYSQLNEDSSAPLFIVFTESGNPRELSSLSRSGIRTTIFPPLSGRGFQSRLQTFMSRKQKPQKDKAEAQSKTELSAEEQKSLSSVRAATHHELPKDDSLKWSLVEGSAEDSKIWRCEVNDMKTKSGKVYMVESEDAPRFDKKNKKWLGVEGLVLANDEPEKFLSPVLAHKAFNLSEYRIHAAELNEIASAFRDFRKNSTADSIVVENAVRESASQVFTSEEAVTRKLHQLQTAGALVIRSKERSGYLLLASADNSFEPKLLEALAKLVFPKLGIEPANPSPDDLLCIQLDPISYEDWNERLEFVAIFNHQGQDVAVVWVPSPNLPSPTPREPNLLSVGPKDNLFQDSTISFDLYLHMPKNDKYLLYLKKGAAVSANVLQKFEKFKVDKLAIEKSALQDFIAYLINGVIKPPNQD